MAVDDSRPKYLEKIETYKKFIFKSLNNYETYKNHRFGLWPTGLLGFELNKYFYSNLTLLRYNNIGNVFNDPRQAKRKPLSLQESTIIQTDIIEYLLTGENLILIYLFH